MASCWVFESRTSIRFIGGVARVVFIALILFNVILTGIWLLMLKIFGRTPYVVAVVVALISVLYYQHGLDSCAKWEQGLNTSVSNEGGVCIIPKPAICFHEAMNGWLSATHWLGSTCEKEKPDPAFFKEEYNITSRFIGMAPTTKFAPEDRAGELLFPGRVVRRSKGYDTLQEAKNAGHDQIIDTKNMELVIDVQRNETLVQLRKEKQSGDQKDLVVIFIDAISRIGA